MTKFDLPDQSYDESADIPMTSGERLKALLKANGMKQRTAAERLHYQPNHISMICANKRRLTPDLAKTICGWFPGTRPEYLLCVDNCLTIKDYYEALKHDKALNEGWNEAGAVTGFLENLGYTFDFDTDSTCYIHRYTELIGTCIVSESELESFEREIRDFAEFKIKALIERSVNNG